MGIAGVLPPLRGLSTAKALYCDNLAELQYMGVNALFVPFTFCKDERGQLIRKVEFTVRAPIGCMPDMDKIMRAFMAEHSLRF